MAFQDLREFIDYLDQKGDLLRVKPPVKVKLQITELHKRLLESGKEAAFIENPIDDDGNRYDMPVLVNLFGAVRRVAWGMGKEPHQLREFGELLAFLRQPTPPQGVKEALAMAPLLKKAMSMRPKYVKKAPVHEVIKIGDEIDLYKLPIQSCWPNEPAPLITWPLIVTKGPKPKTDPTDQFNLGIYRLQLKDHRHTLMRWLKHRGGAQHYRKWKSEKQEPLPAAAVIGCDPGTILAAVTPTPDNLSEYKFAGLLRDKPVELVKCKTVDIDVPAHAEIVIEGKVHIDWHEDEGPYGDHTGYYNSVEPFPVFEVTAITHRKNPIYLSTYTGRPPDEPSVLGEALNELFIPLLQQQYPEITDFWLPPEGCSYRVAVVSIKKSYAGQARKIMMGVWSFLRQFMYTKWVIVVDDDINVRNWKDVIWTISTRADPVRDIMLVDHTPIDYLDFASPVSGIGSKMGLDATNKMDGETQREWGRILKMDDQTIKEVDTIMDEILSSKAND